MTSALLTPIAQVYCTTTALVGVWVSTSNHDRAMTNQNISSCSSKRFIWLLSMVRTSARIWLAIVPSHVLPGSGSPLSLHMFCLQTLHLDHLPLVVRPLLISHSWVVVCPTLVSGVRLVHAYFLRLSLLGWCCYLRSDWSNCGLVRTPGASIQAFHDSRRPSHPNQ